MSQTRPPVIGITCIRTRDKKSHGRPRVGQNQAYISALVRAGAAPLLIPQLSQPDLLRSLYDLLDGLLLPGGQDVDPAIYGQERQEWCGSISPERDGLELRLVRWAMAEGMPLLAICRGIQVLNVALGGSLHQDIATELPGTGEHAWYPGYPRDRLSHDVDVTPDTRLARVLGTCCLPVNSLHHQAIKCVAQELVVAGRAPDNVIEAVEAVEHPFALGVQWHPEELASSDVRAQHLFDALVGACQT